MLGFAHREVARNQVKCLLFHSIIVEYPYEKKYEKEAKKPGKRNERRTPRTGKRNEQSLIMVSGPEKYGSIL